MTREQMRAFVKDICDLEDRFCGGEIAESDFLAAIAVRGNELIKECDE